MSTTHKTGLLSTGMEQLDTQLTGGLVPGSVIVVEGVSESLAQQTFLTLTSVHQSLHISFGQIPTTAREGVIDGQSMETNETTIATTLTPEATEELPDAISEATTEIERHSVLAIEPMNFAEQRLSDSDYQMVLSQLRDIATESRGLAILFAVTEPGGQPQHRWLTKESADYLLHAQHQSTTEGIVDSLALTRVPPQQNFQSNNRVFQLERQKGGVNINTRKTYDL